MQEKRLKINARDCRLIVSKDVGMPILFLHGFSYTSDVWRRIGVLEALTAKKIPFLALDMPYGKQSECTPRSRDEDVNMEFALEVFKNEFGEKIPMVIVGASLGGHIALKCATKFPTKGLLLISPTRIDNEELVVAYKEFDFPVRVIWGSKDRIVSKQDLQEFISKLPKSKLSIYQEAGHSAYKDLPEKFKQELIEFYTQIDAKSSYR